jgi:hypothetical protein
MKRLLLFSLAVISAASLSAQTGSVLTGRVMDLGQAPLPGVKVTVSGTVERTAITGAGGEYKIDALPSGTYRAKAELVGFVTATETVTVPERDVTVDFHLRVAPLCGPDPPLQVFFPFEEHLKVLDVSVAAYLRIREVRPRERLKTDPSCFSEPQYVGELLEQVGVRGPLLEGATVRFYSGWWEPPLNPGDEVITFLWSGNGDPVEIAQWRMKIRGGRVEAVQDSPHVRTGDSVTTILNTLRELLRLNPPPRR